MSSPSSPDKVVLSPASSDVVLSSSASPDKVVTIPASPDKVVPSPASSDSPDLSHTMMQSSLQPSPMMAGIPASAYSADHFSSLLSCPICNKSCSSCSLLWQHINSVYISMYVFPSATFFACCNRLICSVPSCRWATQERFRKTGCRRLLKPGQHCNAPLVSASDLSSLICDQSESQSPTSPSPPSSADHFSSLLSCPICNKSCSSCSLLWQHINSVHISMYVFPSATFFACCNRLICSVPSCRWATQERFRKTGCRRLLKPGQHCNAPLVSASDLPSLICDQSESQSPTSPSPPSSADHFSSLLSCPICNKSCSSCSLLWQHINSVHISMYVFPSATFFACCNRLICSVPSCRWATQERFRKTGCRRLLKPGQHCNAPLVSASDLPSLICDQSESQSPTSPSPPSLAFSTSIPSGPLELALLSASACSFVGPPHLESEVLSVVMNYVVTCPVSTVVHIPHSVCPLLARVLSTEFRNAISSVWGFMHLFLFAKLALCMPPLRQRRRRFILASVLLDHLHLWSQPDGLYNLWKALQDDLHVSRSIHCIQSSKHNISRALF